MPKTTLKIQNTNLHVEGIKKIDRSKLTPETLENLKNDGLDEIIFQKGDQLYIAYKRNMDLSHLKINGSEFNAHNARDSGQMFATMDGEPVKVLFKDDENQESFWHTPFKSIAGILDDPAYKASAIGFLGGAIARTTGMSGISNVYKVGVYGGTSLGTTAAVFRYESELSSDTNAMAAVGAGVGYLGGHITGGYIHNISQFVSKHPKAMIGVAIGAGVAIGTGLILDRLYDNRDVSNYAVVNYLAK